MKKLLLLATKKIEDQKYILHVLELEYQKVIKVIKMETADSLMNNWRVGYITEVERISKWTLDDTFYITSKEKMQGEYTQFTKLLLDKASYPDGLVFQTSGFMQGIIRACDIKILEQGEKIEFSVWGTEKRVISSITDPWWIAYWKSSFSKENCEKYERYLSASKRKVFGIVERTHDMLVINKLVVM